MGNKNSSQRNKNRRPSLVREDSVFSEASWDFCEDAENVDNIELQILKLADDNDGDIHESYHNDDDDDNECACDDCQRRSHFGLYVMTDRQYRNWCQMFGSTISNEMQEARHRRKVWKIVEIFTRNPWLRRLFVRRARPCLEHAERERVSREDGDENDDNKDDGDNEHNADIMSSDARRAELARKRASSARRGSEGYLPTGQNYDDTEHNYENIGHNSGNIKHKTDVRENMGAYSLSSGRAVDIPGRSPARNSAYGKSPQNGSRFRRSSLLYGNSSQRVDTFGRSGKSGEQDGASGRSPSTYGKFQESDGACGGSPRSHGKFPHSDSASGRSSPCSKTRRRILASEKSQRRGSDGGSPSLIAALFGRSPTSGEPRARHFSANGCAASSQSHVVSSLVGATKTPDAGSELQRRRRCNSEPISGVCDEEEDIGTAAPEEIDLEAELQWLTAVTDSVKPSGHDSDLEHSGEAMSDCDELFNDYSGSYQSSYSSTEMCLPDEITRKHRTAGGKLDDIEESDNDDGDDSEEVMSLSSEQSWEPTPFDLERELEFLCEPEWNNLELELFWHVLRPHLENLLQPQHAGFLPDPCQRVSSMDPKDPKQLDQCLLHVQWHIWKGSYRQAVSDFRAVRRHFRCTAQSQLIDSELRDDVESLRLIFQRKRPSRFRLWI